MHKGGHVSAKHNLTIKDLAAHVGLSVGTVSMALNDSEKIAKSTRDRVKKEAEELGFKKNPFARSLSLQTSGLIGCTVPDLSNNFYSEMIFHLQAELNKRGYILLIGCTNESSREENNLINQFIDRGVDGIITVPVSDSSLDLDEIRKLVDSDFPIVFISAYYRDIPRYTVMCDLKDGMYQLTKKMVEGGHRNIVLVTGRKDHVASMERVAGFRKAIDEMNIPSISYSFIESEKVTFLGGYSAINNVYFEKKPDLVMAINDIMAMGIISSLKSQNVRIPDDVSVSGFDDISIAEFQETPLTTVSQSMKEMCSSAVSLLIKRISGKDKDSGVTYVPSFVVERKSTKSISL